MTKELCCIKQKQPREGLPVFLFVKLLQTTSPSRRYRKEKPKTYLLMHFVHEYILQDIERSCQESSHSLKDRSYCSIMKNILLIQFRSDVSFLHERMCFYCSLLPIKNMRLTILNALDESVLWKRPQDLLSSFDGVILGGSGEFHFPGHKTIQAQNLYDRAIHNVRPLVERILAHDIPTLGICFGHQLLSHILGTIVVYDPKQAKKAGSYRVCLTKEGGKDPIFSDIPKRFFAQYAHRDSLSALPQGSVLLAKNGKRCQTSAFRYRNNIYGVQFHPEMTEKDFFFRLKISSSEYYGKKVKLYPTREAQRVLMNFIKKKVLKED